MLLTVRVGFEWGVTRPDAVSIEVPKAATPGSEICVFVELTARRRGISSPAWPILIEGRAERGWAVLEERTVFLAPAATALTLRIPLRVDAHGRLSGTQGELERAPVWSLRAVVNLPGLLDMASEPSRMSLLQE